MYNIFFAAFSYAAALVGAGFASGQEIISFFVKYGKMSFFGVLFSALLMGLFAAVIIYDCVRYKTYDYGKYLDVISSKRLKSITEVVTFVFGMSVFCVMASCSGEMGYALFGFEPKWGVLVLCIFCAVVFAAGTDGALNINAILGGIIAIGIISCCFYILTYREHQTFSNNVKMTVSSMSYSGYNLLTAGGVLAPLSKKIKSKTDAWLVGIVSTCIMFAMMFLMWCVLGIYYGKINLGEIPMLTMAMRQNTVLTVIYSVLLFAAVFSTAISNGVSCINMISPRIGRAAATAIVVSGGLCFGGAGFSNLINNVYRVCGYAGIVVVGYIIIFFLKNQKTEKNDKKQRKIK